MSFKFDRSEVPQFIADTAGELCVACSDPEIPETESATGLCRACWRVVILGPAMENKHEQPRRRT